MLLPMLAGAQSFVADNKVWNIDVYAPLTSQYAYSQAYIIEGDTIVGGKQAKKFYYQQREGQKPDYMMAVYEEDGKVWNAKKGTDTWNLVYDFSLETGGEAVVEGLDRDGKYKVTVKAAEKREIKGTMRKVLLVNTSPVGEDNLETSVWVEGVGCTYGPLSNCGMGLPAGLTEYRFTTCAEGGEVIYDLSDTQILNELIHPKADGLAVSNPTMSACKYESDIPTRTASPEEGEWLDYSVEKRDDGLYIHFVHENIFLCCGSHGLECTSKKEGNTITIDEYVLFEGDEDCVCPYDVTYDAGPLQEGDYTLVVTFYGRKKAETKVYIGEPLHARFNVSDFLTRIEEAELAGVKESEIIYDLQGRRYTSFPFPGIFIKDGKKVIWK